MTGKKSLVGTVFRSTTQKYERSTSMYSNTKPRIDVMTLNRIPGDDVTLRLYTGGWKWNNREPAFVQHMAMMAVCLFHRFYHWDWVRLV